MNLNRAVTFSETNLQGQF
jgi:hypothetical protein